MRYSSSFFIEEKKASATALLCGLPDGENDCFTEKARSSLQKLLAVYWAPRSLWKINPAAGWRSA